MLFVLLHKTSVCIILFVFKIVRTIIIAFPELTTLYTEELIKYLFLKGVYVGLLVILYSK